MQFDQDSRLTPVNMAFYRSSFVTGVSNENRLRIRYFFRSTDGRMFADIWFGPEAEGPPGQAHGGSIAAILDEAMGVMAWFNRHPVVTANLNVDFKAPMPLGREAVLETWIERVEGKKIYTYGEIRSEGQVRAVGRGLFIAVPLETLGPFREIVARHYGF